MIPYQIIIVKVSYFPNTGPLGAPSVGSTFVSFIIKVISNSVNKLIFSFILYKDALPNARLVS
jgi:hypothetical protein